MANIYTSGLVIKNNIKIEKERRLPMQGDLLCTVGDTVKFDDIIAEGEIKGVLATVKLASILGISPDTISKHLTVKINEEINRGDIVGRSSSFFNLFKSECISPYTGILEYINETTGNIGIRLNSTKIKLDAYINGKVKEIVNNDGAIIETNGTLIQGIFGIGGEKHGILKVITSNVSEDLKIEDINSSYKDCILVGGRNISIELIRKCEAVGVVGIICGAVSDDAIKKYINKDLGVAITGEENTKLSIILTEGFGSIYMSERTFNLLKELHNKNVAINGTTQIRAGVIRPEIIYSESNSIIDNTNISQKHSNKLMLGDTVRITSEPYFCKYGIITNILEKPILLETGNYANCVEIELENKKIIVPRTNIEVIYE